MVCGLSGQVFFSRKMNFENKFDSFLLQKSLSKIKNQKNMSSRIQKHKKNFFVTAKIKWDSLSRAPPRDTHQSSAVD
tara:strand:+ start:416 stop:646 length:231 start_codon:yes stop_codon:yes gene_type:complete